MHTVYLVTCVMTGNVYVGVTGGSVESRWHGHCSASRRGSLNALHCVIRKHGPESFSVSVLGTFDDRAAAHEFERRMIVEHKSRVGDGGYNMTSGGDGLRDLSEESKTRIAVAHRKENLDPSTIELMRSAKLGRHLSGDTRKRMSDAKKGKKFTDDHRRHLSEARRGGGTSSETRKKIGLANSRPVIQMTPDGDVIAEYPSVKVASEVTGVHCTNVSSCCLGHRKHARGFVWRYLLS